MTGLGSANRIGFHVRLLTALGLSLLLPAAAAAQQISCSDLSAAERENEQSWLKLEMDYPILMPILTECFSKNKMSPAAKPEFQYIALCAAIPCGFAKKLSGEDVCTPLASQVIQYHFRKNTIQERKRTLGCT